LLIFLKIVCGGLFVTVLWGGRVVCAQEVVVGSVGAGCLMRARGSRAQVV
jgi:hypothetical protein